LTYVDTSILVAYFCPEPLSARVQRELQAAGVLAISPLVDLEFVSAISRKVRTHQLRRKDAQRILKMIQSHLDHGMFGRLAVDASHFAKARGLLETLDINLQTLDALHVAVAALSGCLLMTADAVLARACGKVGVPVHLIQ
jgi:uncharacterized protein